MARLELDKYYTPPDLAQYIVNKTKEIINEAITYDAVYESLENMFSHKFFKSWEFKDITANYPQTQIIREFLRQLIQKDGFNNEVKSMLDKDITNKMEELKNLNNRIESIKQQIEDIT